MRRVRGTRFARIAVMINDTALHGRSVLSSDGQNLGQVTGLQVDPQQLRIAALNVRLHKDVAERLGLPRGLFHGPDVSIPAEQVQTLGDAVILNIVADALRTADGDMRARSADNGARRAPS